MRFVCSKCGYQKDICIGKDIYNDIEEFKCILCQTILTKMEEEKPLSELVDEVVNNIIINSMKKNIEKLGNDRTWYIIENNIHKPEQRIKFRKFFFLAGGSMPEKTEEKI